MKHALFRTALLLGSCISSPAPAQTPDSKALRNDANEIIVVAIGRNKATSASKAETPLIESLQTISIVTREEMDTRAAATISDALAYTAGVRTDVWGISSTTDEITVRGFAAGGF